MRNSLVGLVFALAFAAGAPAHAQFLTTDASRVGMGGLTLHRGGDLIRYNQAYRSVPSREGGAKAKLTIPIPLGLIQFFHDHPISQLDDDPMFNPDSAGFDPFAIANLVLNPPIFLEVKRVRTPANDVEFTIGKNELIIDLGRAQVLVPSDEFGFGGQTRLLDPGFGFKGFRLSIMGWMSQDVGLTLGDTLRRLLKEGQPATPNTRYNLLADATGQFGFAPSLSYSGKVLGDTVQALYFGAAVRRYWGTAYGHVNGDAGFITGDTLFASPGPTEDVSARVSYSAVDHSSGTGVGVDVGFVFVSGPVEFGLGVNDIGATLTWPDTRVDSVYWDAAGDTIVSTLLLNHVETTTRLATSYIANVALVLGTGTTVGGNILYNGRRTAIHVGGEQRLGPLALRGGVSRDGRKRMQFGFGGGLYFGSISLDVGFATHSTFLSDERGITMATSVSIY